MNDRPMTRVTVLRATLLALLSMGSVRAHDTWVQVSSALVRPGDVAHVDLVLGNHGNDHRDFKVAGKLATLDGATLAVIGPDGTSTDLVPVAVDLGLAAKEGYWSARCVPRQAGLHCIAHTRSGVRHGKMGFKGSKAWFLVADGPGKVPASSAAFREPLGHPLEFVLDTDPVLDTAPGQPLTVRLLFRGQPLAGQRVSFVPRGATLAEGFDPEHERTTDAQGRVSYTPREGTFVLVVAHLTKPEEKGDGYDATAYAATLVLDIPQRSRRD